MVVAGTGVILPAMAAIEGTTTLVGLLGDPVAGSLSPRMQNAAFAARGLDWAYVPLRVDHAALGEAVAGLVALGFAGANVTTPHKTSAIPFCDELEESAERAGSVNTLVIREGRVTGLSTDAEALDKIEAASAAVVGAGGAAAAWIAALEARWVPVDVFARRGVWPPQTDKAELIVHATPVKDELLFEPRAGQTLIELAYFADGRDTGHTAAARAAGARVIDGLEVLARQGAASFERWTGVPAPLDVMRAAIRP
jgi:shikimate dehydrogenase